MSLAEASHGRLCALLSHSELMPRFEGFGNLEEPHLLPKLCTVQGIELVLGQCRLILLDISFPGHLLLRPPSYICIKLSQLLKSGLLVEK